MFLTVDNPFFWFSMYNIQTESQEFEQKLQKPVFNYHYSSLRQIIFKNKT